MTKNKNQPRRWARARTPLFLAAAGIRSGELSHRFPAACGDVERRDSLSIRRVELGRGKIARTNRPTGIQSGSAEEDVICVLCVRESSGFVRSQFGRDVIRFSRLLLGPGRGKRLANAAASEPAIIIQLLRSLAELSGTGLKRLHPVVVTRVPTATSLESSRTSVARSISRSSRRVARLSS